MRWPATKLKQRLIFSSRLGGASLCLTIGAALASAQDPGPSAFRLPSVTSTVGDPGTDASSREGLAVPMPLPRHVTLEQAQQSANQANALAAKVGELGVEAAKQHRLAAQADYLPKFSTTFVNLHFNKFMGETIGVVQPHTATTVATVGIPLVGQDQTLVAVNGIQPITPLFKVRQEVNVARADENIARAKAGLPVATISAVEKIYFDLLVAQKQLALSEARARHDEAGRLAAHNPATAVNVAQVKRGAVDVDELPELSRKVRELTAALNQLIGWPRDTPLELEPPAPLVENISLREALDQALETNPDVIEAAQTVEKAEAAKTLSKLDYIPDLALFVGWAYQNDVLPALPRDFAYIGVLGSYNLFDFGKREHSIRERTAQKRMAETALELTKAKVAAAAKASYEELERARALSDLAYQTETVARALQAKSNTDDLDVREAQAKMSLEILRLDLHHRQAYAALKATMGEQ